MNEPLTKKSQHSVTTNSRLRQADTFTNGELQELEKMQNDLIISLFDTRDKYYVVLKYLKKAFMSGRGIKDE